MTKNEIERIDAVQDHVDNILRKVRHLEPWDAIHAALGEFRPLLTAMEQHQMTQLPGERMGELLWMVWSIGVLHAEKKENRALAEPLPPRKRGKEAEC